MGHFKDLVSIIIPVYNREETIEECILSVKGQSYQNFELIIVDDGSTDGTAEVCRKLAATETRLKLFSLGSNSGVSEARNKALDLAGGEYVFFLDSDDVIHPFLLETLVSGIKNSRAKIGATDVVQVRESDWYKLASKLAEASGVGDTIAYTDAEVVDAMLGGSRSPLGCIGGVMIRRDLIGSTRFRSDLYIGEDFFFLYENIIKGADAVFLKQRWYFVRLHDHNSSWDYSFEGFWTRFYRRKLVWESEESLGREAYARRQKVDAFSCFCRCAERNKPYSRDGKKMRAVLREYKSTILPALTQKSRIVFRLYLYFPATFSCFRKIKKLRLPWRRMKK